MKHKKFLMRIVGVLSYTIIISQATHLLREPITIKEYIEVPKLMIVHAETTEEIEEVQEEYEIVTAIVTAYAPFDNKSGMCNDGDPNKTATGTKPQHGTLAADPKRLPYGTKIDIPNYGTGIVEDTGGLLRADKNNIRIDIFVDTYEEAKAWGKQELEVKIYNN